MLADGSNASADKSAHNEKEQYMKKFIIIGIAVAMAAGGIAWAAGTKCGTCNGSGLANRGNGPGNCLLCNGSGRSGEY